MKCLNKIRVLNLIFKIKISTNSARRDGEAINTYIHIYISSRGSWLEVREEQKALNSPVQLHFGRKLPWNLSLPRFIVARYLCSIHSSCKLSDLTLWINKDIYIVNYEDLPPVNRPGAGLSRLGAPSSRAPNKSPFESTKIQRCSQL